MNTSRNEQEKAPKKSAHGNQCNSEGIKKRKRNRAARKADLRIILHSKSCIKLKSPNQCSKCLTENTETWLFHETSKGSINLCATCKRQCIKDSFGHEAQEQKRQSALKATLKELKERRRKLQPGTNDPALKQAIYELEAIIRKGVRPKYTWSPILSGSFGSGKRK